MDIAGYSYLAEVVTPPGASKGKVRNHALIVLRACDAATASIASLMKNQDSDIKVHLSVFKAGGDASKDMQPTLEIVLEGARVDTHSILTGGSPRRPVRNHLLPLPARSRSAPRRRRGPASAAPCAAA